MRGCLCGAFIAAVSVACGAGDATPPEASAPAPAPSGAPESGTPHGDHAPRYGGLVLMNGDLHFEVVLDARGVYHVYFSDAVRNELPASVASEVRVTIMRPDQPEEPIALDLDDQDHSWTARGQPVASAETTTARVSYSYHGQTYWIDMPFVYTAVPDPHAARPQ